MPTVRQWKWRRMTVRFHRTLLQRSLARREHFRFFVASVFQCRGSLGCLLTNLLEDPYHEVFPETLGSGVAAEKEAEGRRRALARGENLNTLEVVPDSVRFLAARFDPLREGSNFIHEDPFRGNLVREPSLNLVAVLRGAAVDGPEQEQGIVSHYSTPSREKFLLDHALLR
jgi:hypothetical protein